MTDIRIEKENGELHPFQKDVDVRNFYAVGQRGEILDEIVSGVRREVPVIILSGEGGSGKTMICRMVEQRLAGEVEVVIFPKTLESFDDVLRKIALRFGIEVKAQADRKNAENYLGQIVEYLRQSERPVLIVFDEAENLYLATLERIRKMQDKVTAEGAKLLLMFSGRKTFLENNEQLSICDFVNSEELFLTLPLLDDEETTDYLQQGLEKIAVQDVAVVDLFAQIPVITERGDGNFGKLNLFVRELLEAGDDEDGSLFDLLDNAQEEHGSQQATSALNKFPAISSGSVLRKYLPYFAGGALLLLLIVWFWPTGDEGTSDTAVFQNEGVESLPQESLEATEITQPDSAVGDTQAAAVGDGDSPEDAQPELAEHADDEEAGGANLQMDVEPDDNKSQQTAVSDAGQEITAENAAAVDDAQPDADETLAGSDLGGSENQTQNGVNDAEEIKKPVKSKIVVLTAGESLKRKPVDTGQTEAQTGDGAVSEVQEVIASNAHFTVEQLYQKRFQAGVDWKVGERNDMYTVQLMVLTSKNSEQNLKKMLAIDEYRQEAGNFFIFKKRSAPDVIFVFYGEYPTMSFARLAMNSLPKFLQKHKPYAISIKGAMAKVSR